MRSKLLIIILLIFFSPIGANAQLASIKTDLSAIFPNTVVEDTRVMDYINYHTVAFINNSNDSSYLIRRYLYSYLGNTPTLMFHKMPLYSLKFRDMCKLNSTLWYCGSMDNVGVYGKFYSYFDINATNNYLMFKLTDMNNLKKFVLATNLLGMSHKCIFAIGETISNTLRKTHIVELQITGPGISEFDPYLYASPDDKEIIDDIALVDTFIVYTTRDYQIGHSQVNLRLSDINDVLTGGQIDIQNRFQLNPQDSIVGEVFITDLDNENNFEVCYIKHDRELKINILCMHNIRLFDLLHSTNTIISQEVNIPRDEEIIDIKYDSTYQVLLMLLKKDNDRSVFLHTNPYKTTTYSAVRLESPSHEMYYSLDTIKGFIPPAERLYVAWGGNKTFTQEFHTDGAIHESCLDNTMLKVFIVNSVEIEKNEEPLSRHSAPKTYYQDNSNWNQSTENRSCYMLYTK